MHIQINEEKLSPKFSMAMVIPSAYHAFLILKCTSLVIGHNTTETWTFVRLLKVNRSNVKHQLPCLSFSISPMSSCASQVLTSLFTHYRLTLFANVSFLPLWDLKSFKEIVCLVSPVPDVNWSSINDVEWNRTIPSQTVSSWGLPWWSSG